MTRLEGDIAAAYKDQLQVSLPDPESWGTGKCPCQSTPPPHPASLCLLQSNNLKIHTHSVSTFTDCTFRQVKHFLWQVGYFFPSMAFTFLYICLEMGRAGQTRSWVKLKSKPYFGRHLLQVRSLTLWRKGVERMPSRMIQAYPYKYPHPRSPFSTLSLSRPWPSPRRPVEAVHQVSLIALLPWMKCKCNSKCYAL